MITPRNLIHGALMASLSLLATTANAGEIQEPEPDMVAVAVFGPDHAQTGEQVFMHLEIDNAGDPLDENYAAEVLLSDDDKVSADDLVLTSFQSMELGTFLIAVTIPQNIPSGVYSFGLRIAPVTGELKLGNNDRIGPPSVISKVDLHVADEPIVVFARLSDEEAPTPTLTVENAGSPGTVLFYTVEVNAPFVTPSHTSGTAVAGTAGDDVELTIDHGGLPIGQHGALVTFKNAHDPLDRVDVSLTLEVGDAKFNAGDRVQGLISEEGGDFEEGVVDTDEIVFDGVKGMTLRLKAKTSSGDIKPLLTLVDPDGLVETSVAFKHVDTYKKKAVKLKSSGEYRMIISGKDGTAGNYKIKTGRKLPKKAQPRTVVTKVGDDEVEVLALAGATLSFSVTPNDEFPGAPALELRSPSGSLMDLTANMSQFADGSITVDGFPLDEGGEYRLRVLGFSGAQGEKVSVTVAPVQPQKTKNKIFLP